MSNVLLKYNYKNFFQWYKDERAKWDKEHPNDLYDCGIENDVFKYFILQYLYKGPITASDYDKLVSIFKKHSKRYKRENFFKKFFGKEYKDIRCKTDTTFEYLYYRDESFSKYFENKKDITDEEFVRYCQLYLDGLYLDEGCCGYTQYNLNSLHDILIKHSKKFKMEKYLFQLFRK